MGCISSKKEGSVAVRRKEKALGEDHRDFDALEEMGNNLMRNISRAKEFKRTVKQLNSKLNQDEDDKPDSARSHTSKSKSRR